MSKRNTPQRRHNILALLSEQGEVSVDALAKRFATSEVTIRKDLAALETNGLLLRRYGGAVPVPHELLAEPAQPVSSYKRPLHVPPSAVFVNMHASSSTVAAPRRR